ncbi:PREDICTED: uncharacterized protein LOC107342440 isoform X1 [Acropora digitifera]|uniref:uncharacterized protein LOC107342440 isoform X1 n=2 Tax=Acropora digitifera TaxID=70779 RepID=UPI00077A0568|nr:PREDICTED: uncharacterized protein LOC107342440 isoform X1 [Acropora digitifera]
MQVVNVDTFHHRPIMKTTWILMLACLMLVTVLVDAARRRFSPNELRSRARFPALHRKNFLRGSCIALGGTGCEGNNGKCCRKGNPYTGEQRKCINDGTFSAPVYKCVEA